MFNRSAYESYIQKHRLYRRLVAELDLPNRKITYRSDAVFVDPKAPDFNGYTTELTNEELVRCCLLLNLADSYGYEFNNKRYCLETVYDAPGRPKPNMKGSRADLIIRNDSGCPFLFFELKTPVEYRESRQLIDGQLFQSSKLEKCRPSYLVWATVESDGRVDATVIQTDKHVDYQSWIEEGEPSGNAIPSNYGCVINRKYAKPPLPDEHHLALREDVDERYFNSLTKELHDVIWSGGGTNNNEVFAVITRLFLCKIYDEKETRPGEEYRFQAWQDGDAIETPQSILNRMNDLFDSAQRSYLAVNNSGTPAFDRSRIPAEKVAYVVRRLEGISLTKNAFEGDLLGTFFEEIVSHGFTQTRGQFFTPMQLTTFMVDLCDAIEQAKRVLEDEPDGRGIHRLPNVIDPSCGVGSFLITYMKAVTKGLYSDSSYKASLSDRAREEFDAKFAGSTHTNWAKTSLYGIENNYDLGLAAKVNMILHGDGSMSTFIKSGLLPFDQYVINDRPTCLSMQQEQDKTNNEQFDLVLSNPPFSLKMTDAEKNEAKRAFSGALGLSEDLFIERWNQLLRPGGRFCCILPESVCNTDTERKTRLFLLTRYKIKAVISLPYSTFTPYTAVKTCIIYAEKRSADERSRIEKIVKETGVYLKSNHDAFIKALSDTGILEESIFFAEPLEVGYKRRKGLPDIQRPNDLEKVLSNFRSASFDESLRYGFRCTLSNVLSKYSIRFDAKFRWLWDKLEGKIRVSKTSDAWWKLSDKMRVMELKKVCGSLDRPMRLIELEAIRQNGDGVDDSQVEEVGTVESDKVVLESADFVLSRLRPYLGKFIMNPKPDTIGSSELVGLKLDEKLSALKVNFLFSLPEFREAFRMLQTGKQHPRLQVKDLLELQTNVSIDLIPDEELEDATAQIENLRLEMASIRNSIESKYRK